LTVVLALLSALFFGGGVAFQQRAAVTVPAKYAGRPALLVHLVRQPMWLLGVAGDIGGFALQAAALRKGSLIVVQPLLTTSLLFTLTLTAAWSHQPISRSEWVALAMVLAGLAVFLATASPPDQPTASADTRGWVLCVAWVGLVAVVALLYGRRMGGWRRAALFGLAAGMADAFMAVIVKAFAISFKLGFPGILKTWTPYVVVAAGITAMLLIQTAYQAGQPKIALPVITVIDPLVSCLIGVTLFGEDVLLGGVRAPIIGVAAGFMFFGLVSLSRTSPVAEAIAPESGAPLTSAPEAPAEHD
jgi:drug/metabolite transporter (DMT)-like permease